MLAGCVGDTLPTRRSKSNPHNQPVQGQPACQQHRQCSAQCVLIFIFFATRGFLFFLLLLLLLDSSERYHSIPDGDTKMWTSFVVIVLRDWFLYATFFHFVGCVGEFVLLRFKIYLNLNPKYRETFLQGGGHSSVWISARWRTNSKAVVGALR